MKTEHRFAAALKSMMADKPIDEISVLSLCKKCKVNRQTFYYHFHDIYDLLTLVYLDEKIDGIDKTINFYEMIECIFNYYMKNQKFIDATLASDGKDLVQDFLTNNCYLCFWRYVTDLEISKMVSTQDKKNVVRFYASAFANYIIYYITNYKKKSLDNLMKNFSFINNIDLFKIMQNLAKK